MKRGQTKRTKESVLVVDDDKDVTSLIKDLFEDAHYEVNVVSNARDAFEWIFKKSPDLILLDINLPDLDGFHVARELKRNLMFQQIPIVLLSGQPDLLEKLRTSEIIIDEYVSKPFDIKDLLMRSQLVLKRKTSNIDANPLTKLPGNKAIVRRIQETIKTGKPYALGYADLNNFKAYNDKYGFNKGDEIITFAANCVIQTIQKVVPQGGFVGHIGGDDFIFVCPFEKSDQVCQEIITKFDAGVPGFYTEEDRKNGHIVIEDRRGVMSQFPLTSVAIGLLTDNERKYQNIGQINNALSHLKKYAKSFQGSAYVKDRRTMVEAKAKEKAQEKKDVSKQIEGLLSNLNSFLPHQLDEIIKENKISALFQPIVDMSSEDVLGHEGLIRGPAKTALEFPTTIFQQARNQNRVVELDLLCLRVILNAAQRFHSNVLLFMNIFPETVLEQDKFFKMVLNDPQLKKTNPVFELSAAKRESDPADLFDSLKKIKEKGIKLCLDDTLIKYDRQFLYLPQVRPNYIKLDMTQFQGMSHDVRKKEDFLQLVNHVRALGAQPICTKLESRADSHFAISAGITMGQGFLFAPPQTK